jgi:FtsP/CotA-like multicopper oxidase with cupredoxin domain
VNPRLDVYPGQVFRLRVLNVSNARFYRLALQGHTLQVVGTDGGLLDWPYPMPEVLLAPGERVDVLVKASATASAYKLLSLPYARTGSMTSPQITLMTVNVTTDAEPPVAEATVLPRARPTKPKATDVPSVNPHAVRVPAGTTGVAKSPRFVLSMGQGRGYVNGITFTATSAFEHASDVGTEEIWEIVNQSGMDHPWHQHTNDAQLLSFSGGDAAYQRTQALWAAAPAWKDVILVPKWGSVRLRIPVMHYAGHAMMHCHILEHEDIGMMAHWHIMGDGPMPH